MAAESEFVEGQREFLVFVFERALAVLPGSYKLWKRYLDFRRQIVREKKVKKGISDEQVQDDVNHCYERALCNLFRVKLSTFIYLIYIYYRCQGYGWTIVSS